MVAREFGGSADRQLRSRRGGSCSVSTAHAAPRTFMLCFFHGEGEVFSSNDVASVCDHASSLSPRIDSPHSLPVNSRDLLTRFRRRNTLLSKCPPRRARLPGRTLQASPRSNICLKSAAQAALFSTTTTTGGWTFTWSTAARPISILRRSRCAMRCTATIAMAHLPT